MTRGDISTSLGAFDIRKLAGAARICHTVLSPAAAGDHYGRRGGDTSRDWNRSDAKQHHWDSKHGKRRPSAAIQHDRHYQHGQCINFLSQELTGSRNVAIGYGAAPGVSTGNNNIAIGFSAAARFVPGWQQRHHQRRQPGLIPRPAVWIGPSRPRSLWRGHSRHHCGKQRRHSCSDRFQWPVGHNQLFGSLQGEYPGYGRR